MTGPDDPSPSRVTLALSQCKWTRARRLMTHYAGPDSVNLPGRQHWTGQLDTEATVRSQVTSHGCQCRATDLTHDFPSQAGT